MGPSLRVMVDVVFPAAGPASSPEPPKSFMSCFSIAEASTFACGCPASIRQFKRRQFHERHREKYFILRLDYRTMIMARPFLRRMGGRLSNLL